MGNETHQQFILKSTAADYLVCRTWDGLAEGTVDVYVAKPWLLRVEPHQTNGRGGVTFVYETDVRRVASKVDVGSETQEVLPTYRAGDFIYAIQGVGGGTGASIAGTPLEWLEINAGRQWVKVED